MGTAAIHTVTTVIIGAGHAGLAMSRCLAERSIDHVVLERGEVANSWRFERWDSLRLLTPNWQSRLPGFSYNGGDPDGYRTLPEVIDFIASYAKAISAPLRTHTTVTLVRGIEAGYLVRTIGAPGGGTCFRGLQHCPCSWLCRSGAALDCESQRPGVPKSQPTRRRRCPGGGRILKRNANRL